MNQYQELIDGFIEQSVVIFGRKLVGIYLHGSAAMGCFHSERSDIDLLVVVSEGISDREKRTFMDMVVALNGKAPKKGLELSVVKREVCKPFIYPTPFELHFSVTHLEWYLRDPVDYVARMRGVDRDLAAHCTILYHRGKTLWGEEIAAVFGEVPDTAYFDSIWNDIENAKEDIAENPVYVILNLCRVLAYRREGLILSKREGGEWALRALSATNYIHLVSDALLEYAGGEPLERRRATQKEDAMHELVRPRESGQGEELSVKSGSGNRGMALTMEFATYMLEQIRKE